jgi:phosphodiesterase/alkaline phosphatase D-like protein
LQPGKTYYYTVTKPDGSPAAQAQFKTPGQEQANNVRIVNGPSLESVGDNHAVVAWSTTKPASTVVKYGTDRSSLTKTAQAPWGSTTHRVELKNLQPNTQYYFQVLSGQAQGTGTMAQGGEGQFRTVGHGQQALVLSGPSAR